MMWGVVTAPRQGKLVCTVSVTWKQWEELWSSGLMYKLIVTQLAKYLFLWNPKFHKSLPPNDVLYNSKPVHALTSSALILCFHIHLAPRFYPCALVRFRFSDVNLYFFSSPECVLRVLSIWFSGWKFKYSTQLKLSCAVHVRVLLLSVFPNNTSSFRTINGSTCWFHRLWDADRLQDLTNK